MMYIILFLLMIIIIQNKLFNEHYYFIIALPIFIPIMVMFILFILRKNKVFLIESRMQGELFYEMGKIPDESGIKETIAV